MPRKRDVRVVTPEMLHDDVTYLIDLAIVGRGLIMFSWKIRRVRTPQVLDLGRYSNLDLAAVDCRCK